MNARALKILAASQIPGKLLSRSLATLLLLTLCGHTARATIITWTNTSGGNWNVATNWSPNQVPSSTDSAFITNNGTYTVTLNASATVASLTLGGASGTQTFVQNANTLTLNGASTVGNNGAFNLGGGILSGAGSFTINGPFSWSSGTVNNTGGVTLNGAGSLSGVGAGAMTLSGPLINAGALTWSGSGNNLIMASGTLTNLAAGTITITTDISGVSGGGFNSFGNAGLLRKTGGTGTTTLSVPFVNTGDVQVQSGTLDMAGGGLASGTFEVSANATLQFGGTTYTLSAASNVTGAGKAIFSSGTINAAGTYDLATNTFSGATVNFSGNYTITGQPVTISAGAVNFNAGGTVNLTGLTMSGGALGGTLPVPVNGPFSWSSGTINNTGGVTLNGAGSLSGVGAGAMTLSGPLINAGALTWSGSGNNLVVSSGTLTNLAAGTITITTDISGVSGGGFNSFGNAGLLRKTGGTGTTTLSVPFANTGDVEVQSGTLDMAGGGSASGTFEVSANAAVQFVGATYTLSAASSVTGAGKAIFTSGTINASGTYNLATNTFSGATVNFSGNYTITGQPVTISAGAVNFNAGGTVNLTGLTISGGALGGTLPVPVNGPFSWSSGTLNNTGGVTLNGAGSLSGVGAGAMTLSGLLINAGALTWSGSGNNLVVSSGTLTNLAAGTITITADISGVSGGGFNSFGNAGLLRKTGGTGTTTLSVPFVNTGTLDVQSGTISLANSYVLTNGALSFGISGLTNYGNIKLSGAASFRESLGVNLNGFYWPTVGSSFNLLTYTSESGVLFTNTVLPPFITWQAVYNSTAFTLTVMARQTNTAPANVSMSLAGNTNLNLAWPGDHTGWQLEAQTNSLAAGLGNNWVIVPGSGLTNEMTFPIGLANGSVFFRLMYP